MPQLNSNTTKNYAATAEYIQELWTREIQQPFTKKLQIAKLVNDRSGLATGGGDMVKVPFVDSINARAKQGSTQLTFDVPNGSPVTINIDKHYYSAALIEDIAKIQAQYDLKAAFMERMTESLARQIDSDLMGLYTAAGTTVSGGATIDDADMLAVVLALDQANTPSGDINGVVTHKVKGDLLAVNKYVAYDQTGKTGKAVDGQYGLIGSVYGIDLWHSGNVPEAASLSNNLFFHKSAITKIVQAAPKVEVEYSVRDLGWLTVLHTVYGVGVERASHVINLTRTA